MEASKSASLRDIWTNDPMRATRIDSWTWPGDTTESSPGHGPVACIAGGARESPFGSPGNVRIVITQKKEAGSARHSQELVDNFFRHEYGRARGRPDCVYWAPATWISWKTRCNRRCCKPCSPGVCGVSHTIRRLALSRRQEPGARCARRRRTWDRLQPEIAAACCMFLNR